MNYNTKNTWKVFASIVAITVAVSFGLTSTVRAQDPNEPSRDADWWVSQTTTTPFGTTYYQSAGPDTGVGVTFTNQGYTGVYGSQNYNTGGLTYAGGLPLYVNPTSPMGMASYGSLAPLAASLSGMGSAYNTGGYNTGGYNTAAGFGSIGYTGLTGLYGGGYTTGSSAYPTANGYTTSNYGYPSAGVSSYGYGGLYGGLYGSSVYGGGLYGSSQPSYGSAYGYNAQPAYGNSAYGYTSQPAYGGYTGYTSQPAYGSSIYGYTSQPAYGYTSQPAYGSSVYGYTSQPAYGYTSQPAYSNYPYGAASTPGYSSSNGGYPYIIY